MSGREDSLDRLDDGLHLVEDGAGELVCGVLAAHVAGADLAEGGLASVIEEVREQSTYPSAMTP